MFKKLLVTLILACVLATAGTTFIPDVTNHTLLVYASDSNNNIVQCRLGETNLNGLTEVDVTCYTMLWFPSIGYVTGATLRLNAVPNASGQTLLPQLSAGDASVQIELGYGPAGPTYMVWLNQDPPKTGVL